MPLSLDEKLDEILGIKKSVPIEEPAPTEFSAIPDQTNLGQQRTEELETTPAPILDLSERDLQIPRESPDPFQPLPQPDPVQRIDNPYGYIEQPPGELSVQSVQPESRSLDFEPAPPISASIPTPEILFNPPPETTLTQQPSVLQNLKNVAQGKLGDIDRNIVDFGKGVGESIVPSAIVTGTGTAGSFLDIGGKILRTTAGKKNPLIPGAALTSRIPEGKQQKELGQRLVKLGNRLRTTGMAEYRKRLPEEAKTEARRFGRVAGGAIPSLAVSVGLAAINPVLGLTSAGMLEASGTYNEAIDAKVPTGKALGYALAVGVVSGVSNAIPFKLITGGSVLGGAIGEGMQEMIEQSWGNVIAKIGWDESRVLHQGLLEAAVGGVFGGGVAGGAFKSFGAIRTNLLNRGIAPEVISMIQEQARANVTEQVSLMEKNAKEGKTAIKPKSQVRPDLVDPQVGTPAEQEAREQKRIKAQILENKIRKSKGLEEKTIGLAPVSEAKVETKTEPDEKKPADKEVPTMEEEQRTFLHFKRDLGDMSDIDIKLLESQIKNGVPKVEIINSLISRKLANNENVPDTISVEWLGRRIDEKETNFNKFEPEPVSKKPVTKTQKPKQITGETQLKAKAGDDVEFITEGGLKKTGVVSTILNNKYYVIPNGAENSIPVSKISKIIPTKRIGKKPSISTPTLDQYIINNRNNGLTKEQLTEAYSLQYPQQKPKQITGETQLIAEAKKAKSVEEFVENKSNLWGTIDKFGTDVNSRTKIVESIWEGLNTIKGTQLLYAKYIKGKAVRWESQQAPLRKLVLNLQNGTGDLVQLTDIWNKAQAKQPTQKPVVEKKGQSWIAKVRADGKINTGSIKALGYNTKEDFKEFGLLSTVSATGKLKLDDYAGELVSEGELEVLEGETPSAALVRTLQKHGKETVIKIEKADKQITDEYNKWSEEKYANIKSEVKTEIDREAEKELTTDLEKEIAIEGVTEKIGNIEFPFGENIQKKDIAQRNEEFIQQALDRGLTQQQAQKFAKDKLAELAQPTKKTITPAKQQEIGLPGGVKGFGTGQKGEQELPLTQKAELSEDPLFKKSEAGYIELSELPKLKQLVNKYFTRERGLDKRINVANDQRVGNVMKTYFDAPLTGKVVSKWIKKNGDNAQELIYDAIRGETSLDLVPEEIRTEVTKMRNDIDKLSKILIEQGTLPENLKIVIDNNIGKYVTRAYRLFNDKKYTPTQEVIDRAKAKLKELHPRTFGKMSDADMDGVIQNILDKKDIRMFTAGKKTLTVPQNHFIKRKNIPKELLDLYGEIKNPVWLYLKTMTDMSVIAYNTKFLNTISQIPNLYSDKITATKTKQIPAGTRWGQLANKYVDENLYEFLNEINESKGNRYIERFIVNPFKWTKTIGSLPSHPRNFLGNIMFSILADNAITNPLNLKDYVKAANIILNKRGSQKEMWNQLLKDNVTDNQYWGSEMPKLMNQLMKLDPASLPEKIFDLSVKRPINALGELYNAEDQIYRVAAYLKYLRKTKSRTKAAQEVDKYFTNYSKVPIATKGLRKWAVFGPFISFKSETARILFNAAKEGITGKNPVKLAKLIFVLGLPRLISETSKVVHGIDDEELEKLNKMLPPYRRGGALVYYKNDKGELKAFDLTYLWPTGDFEKAAYALTKGDLEAFTDSLNLFEHPLVGAYSIIKEGRDPYYKFKIRDEDDPLTKQASDTIAALIKSVYLPLSSPVPDIEELKKGRLEPGKLTGYQIKNLLNAYNEISDRFGRVKDLPEEIKNFVTGVRTWRVYPGIIKRNYINSKNFQITSKKAKYTKWRKNNPGASSEKTLKKREEMFNRIEKLKKERAMAATLNLNKL